MSPYRKVRIHKQGEPIRCHFCGEVISKLEGVEADSLGFHSLDGNHENWDPANKVPTHSRCHSIYHHIKAAPPPPKLSTLNPIPGIISWVAEYDLPADFRRKRFYRVIRRYLANHGTEETGWSTQSVVFTDSEDFAWEVYNQARAVGGVAHVYEARRLDDEP